MRKVRYLMGTEVGTTHLLWNHVTCMRERSMIDRKGIGQCIKYSLSGTFHGS